MQRRSGQKFRLVMKDQTLRRLFVQKSLLEAAGRVLNEDIEWMEEDASRYHHPVHSHAARLKLHLLGVLHPVPMSWLALAAMFYLFLTHSAEPPV